MKEKDEQTINLFGLLRSLGSQLHEAEHQSVSTDGEDDRDTDISPSSSVVHNMETFQELTSVLVLTDLAAGGSIGVDQVDTGASAGHIIREVLSAGGAVGRFEPGELILHTGDLGTPDAKGQHARDDIVEWIEVVHPEPPEHVELEVWDEDTTEYDKNTDNQGIHKRSKRRVGRIGGDELTNTSVNEFVDQHHEEGGTGSVRIMRQSPNGPVPADKVENSTNAEIWELGNNQSGNEGNPRVHFRLFLTGIVDITALDEERLKLVDDARSDEDKVPDREHLQIQSSYTLIRAPEGETIKCGGDNVKGELVVDVVSIPEKRDIHPPSNNFGLLPKRHREFESIIDRTGGFGSSVRNHSIQIRYHASLLGGVEPDLMPILVLDSLDAAGDNVNHELSRISLGRALGPVFAKVLLNAGCILANVSKVNRLPALCKEKEGIELSEELRRRLVNRNLERN